METISDKELRTLAEGKIQDLQRELRKWYSILDALDLNGEPHLVVYDKSQEPTSAKNKGLTSRIKENPYTLREKCEKILFEMDEFLTTRDLMNEVHKRYGNIYVFSSFSGSFSQAYRRKSSLIKSYTPKNPTNEIQVLYGLKTWFNPITKSIEEIYKEKIYFRYGVN